MTSQLNRYKFLLTATIPVYRETATWKGTGMNINTSFLLPKARCFFIISNHLKLMNIYHGISVFPFSFWHNVLLHTRVLTSQTFPRRLQPTYLWRNSNPELPKIPNPHPASTTYRLDFIPELCLQPWFDCPRINSNPAIWKHIRKI